MSELGYKKSTLHKCSSCDEEKEYAEYPKNKTSKSGYSLSKCKTCKNKRSLELRTGKGTIAVHTKGPNGIATHKFSRATLGTPLRTKYDMLNPRLFTQWSDINHENGVLVEQVDIIRTEILKGRDAWHEREFHAAQACGFFHSTDMHGADAYKRNGQPVELKVNWVSDNPENNNTLSGSGSFNDYTPERFKKLMEQNYALLIPCYIDHKLICAAEVPVNYKPLADKLEKDLNTRKGRICLNFSFTDWIDSPDVKWHVIPDIKELIQFKHKFSPGFFNNILSYMNQQIKDKNVTSTDIK